MESVVLLLTISSALSPNILLSTSATSPPKTRLTLGYLTGSERSPNDYFYNKPGQSISGAISLAVDEINSDPRVLPEHVLDFVVMETHGHELESVRQTVRLVHENVSAIIGPQESCMYEARIAAAFNVPMISYFCTDTRLSDKSLYPTFARTKPHDSLISSALATVLDTYGWDNVVLVYSNRISDLEPVIHQMLEISGVTVADSRPFEGPVLQVEDSPTFSDVIEDTYMKANVYVVVAEVFEEYRLFLIELHALGHTDHTVVGVDTKRYDSSDPQKYIEGFTHMGSPADVEPFRNYLLLAPSAPVDPGYNNFSTRVNQYLEAPPFNFPNPFRNKGIMKIIRSEASYLYDAVWLYARAAHQALQEGQSLSDGRAIIEHVKGTTYTSAMGFEVEIDEHGDTQGNFTLLSLQDHADGYGMYPVGYLAQAGPGTLGMQYQNSTNSGWS